MTTIVKSQAKSEWWIPAGLLGLGLLPLVGGVVRLNDLAFGTQLTEQNARFMSAPLPISLHIVACSVYFILGAFQFWPRARMQHPHWHRMAGRILIPTGLLSAFSGMWMALTYPPVLGDGTAVMVLRLLAGAAIATSLTFGFIEIRRRSIAAHRAWMVRAYALMIAAGTQPLTLGIAYWVSGKLEETEFTSGMAAGWLLNLAVAEWLIRRSTLADK